MCLTGSGTFSIHEERLQISEQGRKQNESILNRVFKLLARFSTHFRVKVLNHYLFPKLRKCGDKSRNSKF